MLSYQEVILSNITVGVAFSTCSRLHNNQKFRSLHSLNSDRIHQVLFKNLKQRLHNLKAGILVFLRHVVEVHGLLKGLFTSPKID